jgi:hypothetical protein
VSTHADILFPGVCCLFTLGCILAANPFAGAGFVDDWSYADTALRLAQSGHFHYNGWGGPMILVQSIWGAAWILLFGFSFNVLRIATIPFSISFVFLVYMIGRQAGLTPRNASLGALVAGTSPLFLPLSASFMTDAYACFFAALSLYAAMRAIETSDRRASTAWLWLLTASGIVGGAERQSVWAAPAVLVPLLFWAGSFDSKFRRHALASYALLAVSIAAMSLMFSPPPYAPLQLGFRELIVAVVRDWHSEVGGFVSLLLSCGLLVLPVSVCFASSWLKVGADRIVLRLLASATLAFALMLAFGSAVLAPFKGDIVSPFGVLMAGEDALGYRPAVLLPSVRFVLTVLVILSVSAVITVSKRGAAGILKPHTRAVFGWFACSYALVLVPGLMLNRVPDRYLLPLIPVLAIVLLASLQGQDQDRRRIAWIVLVLFAAYGTATTHDFSSALRARVTVAKDLQARGISKERISAGLEYDGWTQLQTAGQIASIQKPVLLHPDNTHEFWFWRFTTVLRPEYVVTYSRFPAGSTGLPSASFTNWLPPFRRYITVLKHSPELTTRRFVSEP